MEQVIEPSSKSKVSLEESSSHFVPPEGLSDQEIAALIDELKDGLGRILDFDGDVKILRNPFEGWRRVQKGMLIRKGYQIQTGRGSFVDITFDSYYLNLAHIEAGTQAIFQSIEPTRIHLKKGTVYSLLEGLRSGERYRVSTSRGTFSAKGTIYAVTEGMVIVFEDRNRDETSTVEAFGPNTKKTVSISEGQALNLIGEWKLEPISQEQIQKAKEVRSHLAAVTGEKPTSIPHQKKEGSKEDEDEDEDQRPPQGPDDPGSGDQGLDDPTDNDDGNETPPSSDDASSDTFMDSMMGETPETGTDPAAGEIMFYGPVSDAPGGAQTGVYDAGGASQADPGGFEPNDFALDTISSITNEVNEIISDAVLSEYPPASTDG